ncbi:MAG: hypothetical protein AAF985_01455 [Bacteroidota bacterium]
MTKVVRASTSHYCSPCNLVVIGGPLSINGTDWFVPTPLLSSTTRRMLLVNKRSTLSKKDFLKKTTYLGKQISDKEMVMNKTWLLEKLAKMEAITKD